MPTEKPRPMAKGFTCPCGRSHRFSMYVFAHWDDRLTFPCACKREFTIRRGVAIGPGDKVAKPRFDDFQEG